MGLDNGIIIKNVKKEQVPYYVREAFFAANSTEFDVVYWRKCWGLRGAVLRVLDPAHKYENNCEIPVEAEDIPALLRALKPFYNERYWEENADSIWEYDEFIDTLLQDWINLSWLEEYLKDNPEAECYFYDSY